MTGIISNADERYGDAILPMLDLSDHLDFTVFARDVGAMKPDQRIFDVTLAAKANVAREVLYGADTAPIGFSDVLHVGNSFSKDFVGARDAGMRVVLLDRFGRAAPDEESSEGRRWREAGILACRRRCHWRRHVGGRAGVPSRHASRWTRPVRTALLLARGEDSAAGLG